jgi:hypothetical protein
MGRSDVDRAGPDGAGWDWHGEERTESEWGGPLDFRWIEFVPPYDDELAERTLADRAE